MVGGGEGPAGKVMLRIKGDKKWCIKLVARSEPRRGRGSTKIGGKVVEKREAWKFELGAGIPP